MHRLLALFTLIPLLSACQTWAPSTSSSGLAAGTVLTLTRAITIPVGRASIYIQGGQVVSNAQLNRYYPYCDFEVRRVGQQAQTIAPGEFLVSRVRQETETVHGPDLSVGGLFGAAPSPEAYSTIMTLAPRTPAHASQPAGHAEVLQLVCEHWITPSDGDHLTVDEIRSTLGGLFELAGAR